MDTSYMDNTPGFQTWIIDRLIEIDIQVEIVDRQLDRQIDRFCWETW